MEQRAHRGVMHMVTAVVGMGKWVSCLSKSSCKGGLLLPDALCQSRCSCLYRASIT